MSEFGKRTLITKLPGWSAKAQWWTMTVLLIFFLSTGSYYIPFHPLSGFEATASAAGGVSTATREGRLAVFDDVWQTIHDRYYDPAFRGIDWDNQKTVYRPQAAEAGSSLTFYNLLQRMVGSLSDAHTRVYAPEEKFDWWKPRFVGVGMTLREVEGSVVVVRVEPHSPPDNAGIRPGDVIETVNGAPTLSLIQQRLKSQPQRREASRLHAVAVLMEGTPETSVEIQWRDKKGAIRTAKLPRRWYQRPLGMRIHRESNEYAVLQVDAFTQSIAINFAREFREKLAASRGIIIDLRENGGGDAEAMAEIASFFVIEGTDLGQFTDRWGTTVKLFTRAKSLFNHETIFHSNQPLIILTSDRTSSAAEIFAASLRSLGRARIVGTETCGCVLAIRTRHTLPDGGALDVSELDYKTAEGEHLEGHSLKPDQLVLPQRNDLYKRHDRTVEAGLKLLEGV
jgi:carboxyl-terminal processing protease